MFHVLKKEAYKYITIRDLPIQYVSSHINNQMFLGVDMLLFSIFYADRDPVNPVH